MNDIIVPKDLQDDPQPLKPSTPNQLPETDRSNQSHLLSVLGIVYPPGSFRPKAQGTNFEKNGDLDSLSLGIADPMEWRNVIARSLISDLGPSQKTARRSRSVDATHESDLSRYFI